MKVLSFPIQYILWHYSTALVNIFEIARNYSWATSRFFSTRLLLSNFFNPIHTVIESDSYLKGNFFALLSHSLKCWMFSFIGVSLRLPAIILAIFCNILIYLLSISIALLWLLLPFSVIYLSFSSITLLLV